MTLEVPSVVGESELEFTASVLLVRPELSQAALEINLIDTEITASNPGQLTAFRILIHHHFHIFYRGLLTFSVATCNLHRNYSTCE